MRSWLAVVVGVQMLLLMPADAEPWVKFTDPNGQFSVSFPTTPMAKAADTAGSGKAFPMTAYMVMKGTARLVLLVVDIDMTSVDSDAKSVLDAKESQLLVGGPPSNARVVTLDGVTGRSVLGAGKDGRHEVSKIFFLKGHLYEVVASTSSTASAQDIQDAQRFSDSFHFDRQ
jgi:hypothetical protein